MRCLLYLDANVFIFAILNDGEKGDAARDLVTAVVKGDEGAVTSTLTVDEVVWSVMREEPREVALAEGRRLVTMPNLRHLDVGRGEVAMSLMLMDAHEELDPRDAIHAACAISHGVYTVVSDDPDFDAVPDLERRPLAG